MKRRDKLCWKEVALLPCWRHRKLCRTLMWRRRWWCVTQQRPILWQRQDRKDNTLLAQGEDLLCCIMIFFEAYENHIGIGVNTRHGPVSSWAFISCNICPITSCTNPLAWNDALQTWKRAPPKGLSKVALNHKTSVIFFSYSFMGFLLAQLRSVASAWIAEGAVVRLRLINWVSSWKSWGKVNNNWDY